MKLRRMSIANEISINISSVLNLLAMCGNTSLHKYSKISGNSGYLRERGRKESVDCEEIDEEAPSLDHHLVSPHDVPAVLRHGLSLCSFRIVDLIKVDATEESLVSSYTAH